MDLLMWQIIQFTLMYQHLIRKKKIIMQNLYLKLMEILIVCKKVKVGYLFEYICNVILLEQDCNRKVKLNFFGRGSYYS